MAGNGHTAGTGCQVGAQYLGDAIGGVSGQPPPATLAAAGQWGGREGTKMCQPVGEGEVRGIAGLIVLVVFGLCSVSGCNHSSNQLPDPGARALYYVHDGKVWGLESGASPVLVTESSDRIRDAVMLHDSVVVQTDRGLYRVSRHDGIIESLREFPSADGIGHLIGLDDSVLGFTWLDPAHNDTHIGLIDTVNWRISTQIMSGIFSIVGFNQNRGQTILQPRGQDPAYGELLMIELDSGLIEGRSTVQGYGTAAVSPDSNRVVTADMIRDGTENHTELREFAWGQDQWHERHSTRIPHGLPETMRLVWNQSGSEVFFLMGAANTETSPHPDDAMFIWRWRGGDDEPNRFAVSLPQDSTLYAMSKFENAWLVSGPRQEQWFLAHETGTLEDISLPAASKIAASAGWMLAR